MIMKPAVCASLAAALFSAPAIAEDDAATASFNHVSCTRAPNEIRLRIENVKESVGLVTAALYPNDEELFLSGPGRIVNVRFAARAPATEFCLTAPGPGAYAIAVYHDKNANRSFDKKAFGLPAEPYGLSNNPTIRLARPKVTEALFEVERSGALVEIALRE